MIKNISVMCIDLWEKNGVIKAQDKESYQYGMELLLSTLLNFMLMVMISICAIKIPMVFLPYTIVYVPLRMMAGGYHADCHWKCVLYTQGTFIGAIWMVEFMAKQTMLLVMSGLLISILAIWFLAPIEAENKPLSRDEWKKERGNTRKLEIIIGTVLFGLICWDKVQVDIVIAGAAANISAAISLITAKVKQRNR